MQHSSIRKRASILLDAFSIKVNFEKVNFEKVIFNRGKAISIALTTGKDHALNGYLKTLNA